MAIGTDLDGAIRLLAEGQERLREQTELVRILMFEGKPTERAQALCRSTQKTLEEIQTHVDYLRDTAKRRN